MDHTLFTDLNAQAAAVWLRAGAALDDVEPGRLGLQSLERVLLAGYRPGEGVAHFVAGGGEVRGLLTDHVHAAWALLDFDEATGNETYGMLAEELMRTAVRTLWDPVGGGFVDRQPGPDDVGLLIEPLKPLGLNCLAARTLHRLAAPYGSAGSRTICPRGARIPDRRLPRAGDRRRAVRHGGAGAGGVVAPGRSAFGGRVNTRPYVGE